MGVIEFWQRWRRRSGTAAMARRELGLRENAARDWISAKSEVEALSAVCESLRSLGVPAEKIRRDDILHDVLRATPDDDDQIELHMDLERWLNVKIDPKFFYEEFLRLRLGDAVTWLASHRRP